MYSINFWLSNPADNNDDCWKGEDFVTLQAARARFEFLKRNEFEAPYIELAGEFVYEVARTPAKMERTGEDREWSNEIMREEMMLGTSYNELMGY